MKKPLLLLAGYGRFGAFAAGFLRSRFDVHVLETRSGRRLAPGLKKASTADIGRFDLLILALPARNLEEFLMKHAGRIRPGAFVADLCAVKSAPLAWMRRWLPRSVSYAGLHPLFGPQSAASGLRGHRIALCRGRSSPSCHRRLLSVLRAFGLEPIETNPVIHDKTMASTLFLTQFIGTILGRSRRGPAGVPFETPSFRNLRLVQETAMLNSPDLVGELMAYNPYCARTLARTGRRFRNESNRLLKISRIY